MPLPTVFLILIALAIPAFFASLLVTSAYHRLEALRRRCSEILREASEAKAAFDAAGVVRLREDYDQAATHYARERRRFPASAVATLLRVAPPEPWPPDEAGSDLPTKKD